MSEASRTTVINGQEYQPAALDWSLGWRYELVRDACGGRTVGPLLSKRVTDRLSYCPTA